MFILSLSEDPRGGETHQLFATSNTVINCDSRKEWSRLGGHVRWRQRERGRETTENSQVP